MSIQSHLELPPHLHIHWEPLQAHWALAATEVHVWAASLDLPAKRLSELATTLSQDEHQRTGRFRFAIDRDRFIAGRGLLREVLGRYLHRKPGSLNFAYGAHGKPCLTDIPFECKLEFNLAHSNGLALIAVTRLGPVGIDLEYIHEMSDALQIAESFFSREEIAGLKALSDGQKTVGFLNLWTRKEAWLKSDGNGLAGSLKEIEFTMCPGEPARLLRVAGCEKTAQKWSVVALEPAEGFVAALVAPIRDLTIHCWRWPH